MNIDKILEYLYECMSMYRTFNGQPPYEPFNEMDKMTKAMYYNVIQDIQKGIINDAQGVHDYWWRHMKEINPNHPCNVSFEELSLYEQSKDWLVFNIVQACLTVS